MEHKKKNLDVRERAVLRIQAAFRGRLARKRYVNDKEVLQRAAFNVRRERLRLQVESKIREFRLIEGLDADQIAYLMTQKRQKPKLDSKDELEGQDETGDKKMTPQQMALRARKEVTRAVKKDDFYRELNTRRVKKLQEEILQKRKRYSGDMHIWENIDQLSDRCTKEYHQFLKVQPEWEENRRARLKMRNDIRTMMDTIKVAPKLSDPQIWHPMPLEGEESIRIRQLHTLRKEALDKRLWWKGLLVEDQFEPNLLKAVEEHLKHMDY
mmetsp:Transcript_30778/g.35036  ORF Transcript_30778/g.35036 Transcript_30778/m.35036 type:complete len:268 (-) Transcript_30778:714-1517(-)